MIIETKSGFLNHLFLWWFTATIFSFIFLPIFFTAQEFDVSQQELSFFSSLGRDVDKVTSTSNYLYILVFEKTGLTKIAQEIYNKPGSGQDKNKLLTEGFSWAKGYADSVMSMAYRGIWRALALWPIYVAGLLTFCIPAMMDGLVVRAKKKYDFLQSNPIFFYGATHSIALCLGLGLFVPIIPMDVNIFILAGYFCLVAFSLWIASANFQTGQ